MNKNEYENDIMMELSPEEEAAIDRALRETAEFDDSQVDYDAMLQGVRRRAKAEGIAVFPAVKKPAERKRGRVIRGILSGFGAAAAVFVVGFAAFTLLMGSGKSMSPSADAEHGGYDHTASVTTFAPADTKTPSADPQGSADNTKTTEAPQQPAHTTEAPEPTLLPTFEPITPIVLPTGGPIKGGTESYSALAAPGGVPAEAGELLPAALPDDMEADLSETGLEVTAGGGGRSYHCRAVNEIPKGMEIGVLRCRESMTGDLAFLWRIADDACLEFEFGGFTREEAEALIGSLRFGGRK